MIPRKVNIKTWDAMEKEFGLSGSSINVRYFFTSDMEKLMPEDRIIEVHNMKWGVYTISSGMIEYEIPECIVLLEAYYKQKETE